MQNYAFKNQTCFIPDSICKDESQDGKRNHTKLLIAEIRYFIYFTNISQKIIKFVWLFEISLEISIFHRFPIISMVTFWLWALAAFCTMPKLWDALIIISVVLIYWSILSGQLGPHYKDSFIYFPRFESVNKSNKEFS